MAQEWGAKLKWPKELEPELIALEGKPAVLVLQLKVHGENVPRLHLVKLEEGWTKDDVYEGCFGFIRPIKNKVLKGYVLSLAALQTE